MQKRPTQQTSLVQKSPIITYSSSVPHMHTRKFTRTHTHAHTHTQPGLRPRGDLDGGGLEVALVPCIYLYICIYMVVSMRPGGLRSPGEWSMSSPIDAAWRPSFSKSPREAFVLQVASGSPRGGIEVVWRRPGGRVCWLHVLI